ncbi:MAG: fibrobacter succinogenes major paralogous domain-containing protein [Flavobacteriales bacterium]
MITVLDLQDFLSTYGLAFEATASTWSCGESITYAGMGYSTVQIGDQCWFAENLRTTTYLNGEAIPQNLSDGDWSSTTSGAMTFYHDDLIVQAPYGGLYNWFAVDDARGLCPSGWHVPTDGEWMTMEMALGMSEADANSTDWRGTDQGAQMKTTYGWYYYGNGTDNGTNSSGFSGLPGGLRYDLGNFALAGGNGVWWSSSPSGSNAWLRALDTNLEYVNRSETNPRMGYSVRCVRDAE